MTRKRNEARLLLAIVAVVWVLLLVAVLALRAMVTPLYATTASDFRWQWMHTSASLRTGSLQWGHSRNFDFSFFLGNFSEIKTTKAMVAKAPKMKPEAKESTPSLAVLDALVVVDGDRDVVARGHFFKRVMRAHVGQPGGRERRQETRVGTAHVLDYEHLRPRARRENTLHCGLEHLGFGAPDSRILQVGGEQAAVLQEALLPLQRGEGDHHGNHGMQLDFDGDVLRAGQVHAATARDQLPSVRYEGFRAALAGFPRKDGRNLGDATARLGLASVVPREEAFKAFNRNSFLLQESRDLSAVGRRKFGRVLLIPGEVLSISGARVPNVEVYSTAEDKSKHAHNAETDEGRLSSSRGRATFFRLWHGIAQSGVRPAFCAANSGSVKRAS